MPTHRPSDSSEISTARVVLFVAVSALLVAVAIAFNRGTASPGPQEETGEPVLAAQERKLATQLARAERDAELVARRFLTAFLRYEVGELTPEVRRALRATTSSEFGRQLLTGPPRRPPNGAFPPRARLHRLDLAFVSPQATLATVEGTAMRGGFEEEFGFVFTLTPDGWLATGASR